MFRKKEAAVIELPRESRAMAAIHTCFMRFPIDVAWLDKRKVVVDARKNVKPWHHVVPKKKAKYIVEMPAGSIVKLGYCLEFP